MVNRIVFLLGALASLLLPLAPAHGAVSTVTATAAPHRGMLYRVRRHGNTTYLFGTIHVGMASFFPLEPQVMQAFTDARQLVIELDPRNAAAFQQALQHHGMYADGDSLEHHLAPATLARVRQALQQFDIPYDRAVRMKPWLIANLLVSVNLEHHGYQRSEGTELHLLALADNEKKPIAELETADYQMALFDDMPDREQEQYLLENMADLDDGQALKQDVALINAWAHANGAAIQGVLQDTATAKPTATHFIQHVLLDQRNPQMADKIAALMDEKGSSFVAIGLLHLVGENGVPALLRKKGYEVEKLY